MVASEAGGDDASAARGGKIEHLAPVRSTSSLIQIRYAWGELWMIENITTAACCPPPLYCHLQYIARYVMLCHARWITSSLSTSPFARTSTHHTVQWRPILLDRRSSPCRTWVCYVILCYVMLCCVMLCCVTLCYVVLCYVM
jgi:hypothetical protein